MNFWPNDLNGWGDVAMLATGILIGAFLIIYLQATAPLPKSTKKRPRR